MFCIQLRLYFEESVVILKDLSGKSHALDTRMFLGGEQV